MRRRTAVKTGRTAAQQAESCRPRTFIQYTAMVDRLSAGYLRPLYLRLAPRTEA